jgi:endonuclease YncB( thermonuclease family)
VLAKEGCWWNRKYAPAGTVLEGLEKEARAVKKGLWADTQPVPPWEWRTKTLLLGVDALGLSLHHTQRHPNRMAK